MTIATQSIVDIARQYYGMEVGSDRAGEIAAEVDALNRAVAAAAAALVFDDSPAEFSATLLALRQRRSSAE
jgi:hypothetical protein